MKPPRSYNPSLRPTLSTATLFLGLAGCWLSVALWSGPLLALGLASMFLSGWFWDGARIGQGGGVFHLSNPHSPSSHPIRRMGDIKTINKILLTIGLGLMASAFIPPVDYGSYGIFAVGVVVAALGMFLSSYPEDNQ